jgi:CubicO group peptidase (beta-lactamase class C family)
MPIDAGREGEAMEISDSQLGPAFEKVIEDAIHAVQPVSESGIALAVIKDRQLCFAGGYGFRDRAAGTKVDADTCFAIGSATKAFTSMVISMHVEERRLAFDVPIKQYVQDFKMKDSRASDEMTLEDILSHRTGLPRHDALWYLGPFTRSQLFYRLQYLDSIQGAFRSRFLYNNMMYTVAGNLLEYAFGVDWEYVVKTRILDRVGMTSSSFSLADLVQRSNHAKGYEKQLEIPFKDFSNIGPAGEMNSTALDMAKWVMLFLNNGTLPGGNSIINRTLLEKMYTGLTNVGNGVTYGLGWFVGKLDEKRLIFHQGDADGNSAYVSFMPDAGLGIVALTNQHCTPDLIGKWPDKVATTIYDYLINGAVTGRLTHPPRLAPSVAAAPLQVDRPPDASLPPSALAAGDYTGMFSNPAYGDMSVSLSGTDFNIDYYGSSWPLHQISDTQFYFDLHAFGADHKVPVIFHRAGTGKVDALVIPFEPTVTPILFAKR